jgi:hypothetical protein
MPEPKKLRMGVDSPSPTVHEEETRVAILQVTVQHYLPEFAAAVKKAAAEAEPEDAFMILHQDAFAADYDDDEYTLLGMAVKYAGLSGVSIRIIGKNHETF